MSYDKLDNLFRKKLKQREFTPSNAAWESMEKMLDGGGRMGGTWRWKVLGLVLLTGLGIWCAESYMETEGAYIPRSQHDVYTQETSITTSPRQHPITDESEFIVQSANQGQVIGIESESDLGLLPSVTAQAAGKSLTDEDELINSNERAIEKATQALAGQSNDQVLAEARRTTESNLLERRDDIQESDFSQSKVASAEDDKNGSVQMNSSPSAGLQTEVNDSDQPNNPRATVVDKESSNSSIAIDNATSYSGASRLSDKSLDKTEILSNEELTSLRMFGPTLTLERTEQMLETSIDSLPPAHRYVKNDGRWEFAIEPYISFDRISKSLSTPNGEWDSSLSYRERNESPIWSQSYGVDIRAGRNGLGFGTGVSFTEYGEDVAYQDISTDSTIYEDYEEWVFLDTTFVTYIYDSAMVVIIDSIVTTEVYDSLFVTYTDSTIITSIDDRSAANGITSLTYVEVPLSISYGFEHKRWSFEPSVGISFGFLRGYRGTYYGVSDQLVEIGTQELVLKKTIVQAHYGVGVGYDLADGLALWVAARSKRGLNSIMEVSDYNQRYKANSMRVGIRYTF